MEEFREKLLEFDYFGQAIKLRFNKRVGSEYQTVHGAICSILLNILMFIYFSSLVVRMVTYGNDSSIQYGQLQKSLPSNNVEIDFSTTFLWFFVSSNNFKPLPFNPQDLLNIEAVV